MHYVGTRASEMNPLRSLPLYTPAHRILGWAPLAAARAIVAQQESYLPIVRARLAEAHAMLGRANRVPATGLRRMRQAEAMRRINEERAGMRDTLRKLAGAQAEVERLENQPKLPFGAPPPAPTTRVLRFAVKGYEAGTTGTTGQCSGWGWHATIVRPNGAGGSITTHPTQEAARRWLADEFDHTVTRH